MLSYWKKQIPLLKQIAKEEGTPLYVYQPDIISVKLNELKQAFKNLSFDIHYAMKANENISLLTHIKSMGIGVDTVSPNEIKRALSVGFHPEQIIFTPSCPSFEELAFAFKNKVHTNIGAIEYFDFILKNYPQLSIGLRINPANVIEGNQKVATAHQDSKFGIPITKLDVILSYIQKGLKVDTLHIHTGSDVNSWKDLARSVDKIFDLAKYFNNLKYLNLGSGFKVKYQHSDLEVDLKSYAQYIEKKCLAFDKRIRLKFEPGKFLVSEAGVFIVKANMVKQGFEKKFVGVNSGFHHLIRPMYYGAFHDIINISNTDGPVEKYDIVGQLCEEDTFAYNRLVNQVRIGDYLMFLNAGAYGYSMIMSHYNLRPQPKEFILKKGL